jgi:ketosteroid isomerase-like protein
MRYLLVLAGLFWISILSCKTATDRDAGAMQVKVIDNTDRAFSEMSKNKGMKAAFLYYIDSTGVLLRPGNYPIVGKDARQYLQNSNDSSFTLTWEPSYAEVSASGDLGFTYGIYTLNTKDTLIRGTYVSIWKKQADGNWKFVLDTGNPGLGKEK